MKHSKGKTRELSMKISGSVIATMLIALASMQATRAAGQKQPQSAQDQLPAFEVASVRPSSPNQRHVNGLSTYPGGKVMCEGCMLQFLIMEAFDIQPFQISGGPGWIGSVGARYDIEAIPPDASQSFHSNPAISKNPPNEEERQMLQTLLIDRFQLKFHRESKEGPIYILMRGSKELKLQAPKDTSAYSWAGSIAGGLPANSGLRGTNISMPQLAFRVSEWSERPVLDQTGLQGAYDFEYRTGIDDDDPNADRDSSILTSLKGLGLKLVPSKGPVDTIVVDHVEQPTEN